VLQDAALSLTAKPVRTVGMVAGIVLGVASATAAVLIADTQQVQIDRRFDMQRSPAIVLQADYPPDDGFDSEALASIAGLEPVGAAGELSIWLDNVAVAANQYSAVSGVPLVVADAGGLAAADTRVTGMAPQSLGLDRKLAWVGADLGERLGLRPGSPETIVVNSQVYSVAGVINADAGFGYLKTSVVVSRATAQRIAPAGRTIRVVASVRPGAAAAVAGYVTPRLDPFEKLGIVDVTPPDGELLMGNVAADLRMIGLALGAFVGFVGMVAVANTMNMTVNQRSRELGLRSAMGWSSGRIRNLILVESGIAGSIAAIIGCALGILTAMCWAAIQGWQLIVAKELPPGVIFAGIAASLVGGIIPARQAAKTSPLTAMRS
jgi:putative ABC transport system permease protein